MSDFFRSMRSLSILFAVLALVLAACGDDDGPSGSDGGAMSDQEFCALIEEMENQADDGDELESFAVFGQIARRAPNNEVRDALLKFAEIAEELDGLDEDDPEAMGVMFGLMLDPEVQAASESIENYVSDVCGFDLGMDDADIEWDFDDDDSGSFGGQGSAMDDLHAGDLREAMASALDQYAPGAGGSGAGIYPSDGATVVEYTVEGADDVDSVALCEALADLVDGMTDDPNVIIKIDGSGSSAERLPGGVCAR